MEKIAATKVPFGAKNEILDPKSPTSAYVCGMELNGQLLTALLLVAIIGQCCFAILHLSILDVKKNRWAIIFFLGFGLHSIGVLLRDRILDVANMPLFSPASLLLLPPTVYLYARQILGQSATRSWLHFLPFFFYFFGFWCIGVPTHPDLPSDEALPPPQPGLGFGLILHSFAIITVLQAAWYYFSTFKMVWQNKKKSQNWFSHQSLQTSLNWILWIVVLLVVGFIFARIAHSGHTWKGYVGPIPIWPLHFFTFLVTSIFALLAYRQPVLYPQNADNAQAPAEENSEIAAPIQETEEKAILPTVQPQTINLPTNKKERKVELPTNRLSDEEMEDAQERLENYMVSYQPYLHPKLKISELAKELELSSHQLSYFINQRYEVNFFHFINKYRIEYAVELLKSSEAEQYTIEAIGKMSGFNSKSTFNQRFKEVVGMSPGKFRKTLD